MKIAVFLLDVGLGGTERAAALWANGLLARGHEVHLLALKGGPGLGRFSEGISFHLVPDVATIAERLRLLKPDVIHTHQFGWPSPVDALGVALKGLGFRVPVVQTNVFGRLMNPSEDAWVTARAFISWTSCVQAAQRAGRPLDAHFLRNMTVVSYPLVAQTPAAAGAVAAFRAEHGVGEHEILCGKIGRPDRFKWSALAMDGFRVARRSNPNLKFLVREPPPEVSAQYREWVEEKVFIPLPMTSDEKALRLMLSSVDIVLHTSKIGESFGYGIAEAMALGKPVITNCTPRGDQAQVELVEDGVSGLLASSPRSVGKAILRLAADGELRRRFGENGVAGIRRIADADASTARLETLLAAVVAGEGNPFAEEDLRRAREAQARLRRDGYGHDPLDAARLGVSTAFFEALRRGRNGLRRAGILKK